MMKHIPHRIAAVALAALCIVTMFPAAAFAASEWNISNDTEIYWVETANSTIDNADLKAQVQLFAQEMQAKVVESQAEVPQALAAALRDGKLGALDYYNLSNLMADTKMRESIGSLAPEAAHDTPSRQGG